MRYKYVNNRLVPYDSVCPPDCWHEATNREHVAYRYFGPVGESWAPRLEKESDAPLLALAGWVPAV